MAYYDDGKHRKWRSMMSGRWVPPVQQARETGAHQARRKLIKLGVDQTRRVDIFGIIEDEGIWLMFQPLGKLFGAYVREADSFGIIINAKHPSSLQRLTAAHEYGHHVLGHQSTLDDAQRVQWGNRQSKQTEAAAWSFATHFLMPLQLVNNLLQRMDLPLTPQTLDPEQAYMLSLELGASYTATVNHLVTLNKIHPGTAAKLLKAEPKLIKEIIGQGLRPQDVRADAWLLDERFRGRLLYPRVNDELHIYLREVPSTGYAWVLSQSQSAPDDGRDSLRGDYDGVTVVREGYSHNHLADQQIKLGAASSHHFVFRVGKPGYHTLRLGKRRPWQSGSQDIETFSVELDVAPRQTGDAERGLSEQQKPLVAAA